MKEIEGGGETKEWKSLYVRVCVCVCVCVCVVKENEGERRRKSDGFGV